MFLLNWNWTKICQRLNFHPCCPHVCLIFLAIKVPASHLIIFTELFVPLFTKLFPSVPVALAVGWKPNVRGGATGRSRGHSHQQILPARQVRKDCGQDIHLVETVKDTFLLQFTTCIFYPIFCLLLHEYQWYSRKFVEVGYTWFPVPCVCIRALLRCKSCTYMYESFYCS